MIARCVKRFTVALLVLTIGVSGAVAQSDVEPEGTPEAQLVPGTSFAIYDPDPGDTDYFFVELNPGESAEMVARVGVFDAIPITVLTYRTNVISGSNGGFAAGASDDEVVEPASWIEFPTETFELDGNQGIDIPFTVSVPDDALPGEYVSALVAEVDTTGSRIEAEAGAAVRIVVRSLIAVMVTVPGEVTASFELGEPLFVTEGLWTSLQIPITNTGNGIVRPRGTITITTADGETVADTPLVMDSVYTGTNTLIDVLMPRSFTEGDYVVSASFSDPDSGYADDVSDVDVTFTLPEYVEPATFVLDPVSITGVGEPVQFADISLTIENSGVNVPTGTVMLNVSKDGEIVEEYVLSQNQAMPIGTSTITTRYIPATGWEAGTYTFEVVVLSVEDGVEIVLATLPIDDVIEIP